MYQPRRQRRQWEPRPLGPDSLLWRYAGDQRLGLTGLSAGILQLLHPAIDAGVVQHSNFFDDPWGRIYRSVPQILGTVYDPEPEVTGRNVRDYHRSINGADHLGRPYNALAPATFWWAHATFQYSVEAVIDRFDHRRMTAGEREDLYLDGIEWYRRYGVSMRPVPEDRSAFRAAWHRYCDEVLEVGPAAGRALDMALHTRSVDLPFLPGWSRPLQALVTAPLIHITAVGGLPARVRHRFEIPWRVEEEVQYRTLQLAVREVWRLVPPPLRFGPTAAAGFKAAAGKRRELEAVAASEVA